MSVREHLTRIAVRRLHGLLLLRAEYVREDFPCTGPWPSVVKQMTGFLLVATAIFFAAPLVPNAGNVLWWLIFACVAASAVFLIAKTIQLAPRPRPLAIASTVAAVLVALGLTLTLAVVG